MPVAPGQMQGVPEQGTAVFGVQDPDKRFIGDRPLTGHRNYCVRHIWWYGRGSRPVQIRRRFFVLLLRLLPGTGTRFFAHRHDKTTKGA